MLAILLLFISIACYTSSLSPTSDVSLEIKSSTTTLCDENCLESTTSISDDQDLNYSDQSASLTNFTAGNNLNPTIKCLPGQSAYTENDLKVIIEEIIYKSHTFRTITDRYYNGALLLRKEYEQCLNDLEERLTKQPIHLKHIMEEIVQMREIVRRLAKQVSTKLNEYDSYEKIFNDTNIKVNEINADFENTLKICEFNCQHNKAVNTGAVLRSRRYFEDSVYCSTYGELVKIIKDRLNLFQTEYITEMTENIKIDSNILKDKIAMIKNKLKEAGLKYFGITSYEILCLQDEYYHLWEDLQKFNGTKYLDEIEINYYKVKSHLVELEGLEIRAREYCNHCNDDDLQINGNLIKWTAEFPSKVQSRRWLNRNYQREMGLSTKTILDRVLNDVIVYIKSKFYEDYITIFKDLKEKLDDTEIIKKYLTKLKPLHDDVANEVKNEIKALEDIQRLVTIATRDKVTNLLRISEVMLEFIKHEIVRIKNILNIN